MILKADLRTMFSLALPLVAAELGWMARGIVDTMFVGRVNAEAIGAVSIGTTVFHTVAIIAAGLTLGLDTLVSHAFGAGDRADCRRSLVNGVWLGLFLTPVVMLIIWLSPPLLDTFGVNGAVMRAANPYIQTLNWSTLPLLLYFVLRRYLQAMGIVRPIMFTLAAANIVNIAGNWIFVFGNLGAPQLGAAGSAWATFASRVLMLGCMVFLIVKHEGNLGKLHWPPDFQRIARLLKLGIPASAQIGIEFVVWTAATILAGRFVPNVLAGHQIALLTVSTTYMMPLGVSTAAAVLVGQAIGRRDGAAAAQAGWTALTVGSVLMSAAALVLITLPGRIAAMFSPDAAIIAAAVPLLRMAAFFQLFDGLQVVVTGAMRGVGDTRTPMLCHFTGYWLLGMPLGALFAFKMSMDAFGLWLGLSLGVITIGTILLILWQRIARRLRSKIS
jgi:multidrug resistance protein, MATE family